MNWSDWQTFVHMGGYGLYVWGSLGATAVAIAVELWQLKARLRALRSFGADGLQGRVVGHESQN